MADDSGIGGTESGIGGFGYGMGGSGYGGGDCCPTKKIWGSMNPETDGFYDLVLDEYMMQNMMENGERISWYAMASHHYQQYQYYWPYWRKSGRNMGSGNRYGMGSGYGNGMGSGYGDMEDMEWPERCRSFCIYKKRDSGDERAYCFARSSNSQSMCMRDDDAINVPEWEGSGSGYYGMGSGSGMETADPMDEPSEP